jgi:hypothetical protein
MVTPCAARQAPFLGALAHRSTGTAALRSSNSEKIVGVIHMATSQTGF